MNRELLDRAIQEHDTVTLGMHDEKYIQDLLDLKLFTNICLNKYVDLLQLRLCDNVEIYNRIRFNKNHKLTQSEFEFLKGFDECLKG